MAKQPFFVVPIPTPTLTANATVSGFPPSNVNRLEAPGLTWRSSSAPMIRGDFGVAQSFDFMAIISANPVSSTMWRVRLGDTQAEVDGSSAAVDTGNMPFIAPSGTLSRNGLYHSFYELPSLQTRRWWRIDMNNTFVGTFEAAAIVIGKRIPFAKFYDYEHESGIEDRGALDWNRTGAADYTPGIKLRTKTFTLNWMTEAEYETGVRPMIEALGESEMVYCCFDPEATVYRQNRTYLGRFKKSPVARGRRKPGVYGADFEIVSPY